MEAMMSAAMNAGGQAPWQCDACGFSNGPRNEQCGGQGPLGCNAPRPQPQNDLNSMLGQMNGSSSFGPAQGQGKGKSKSGPYEGDWICDQCNFKNRGNNEVCGGNGPAGCKSPRPEAMSILGTGSASDWMCSACNYRNRSNHSVCGGRSGLGCGAPREIADAVMLAQDPSAAFADLGTGGKPVKGQSPSGKGAALACGKGEQQGRVRKTGWDIPANDPGQRSLSEQLQIRAPESDTFSGFGKETQELMSPELSAMFEESNGLNPNGVSPSSSMNPSNGVNPAEAALDWMCAQCNFRNVSRNQICGGNGPVGCKAPRSSGSYPLESATDPWKGKGKGKGCSPGAADYEPEVPGGLGNWVCDQCGFKNPPGNAICGGLGQAGCKIRRVLPPADPAVLAQLAAEEAAAEARGPQGEVWVCPTCNFRNRIDNKVCGGAGPAGCKSQRPITGPLPNATPTHWNMVRNLIKGKGKGKDPEWVCRCGFKNKMTNEVCGGNGPMGCKSPKPFSPDSGSNGTMQQNALPVGMQNTIPDDMQEAMQQAMMQAMQECMQNAGVLPPNMPNVMPNGGMHNGML